MGFRRTKKVLDNVSGFVFDWHDIGIKNLARAALIIEQRDRSLTQQGRKSISQQTQFENTALLRSFALGKILKKSLDMSPQLHSPSITRMGSRPAPLKMSRIPRSPISHSNRRPMIAASTERKTSSRVLDSGTLQSSSSTVQSGDVSKASLPAPRQLKPQWQAPTNHPYITAHLGEPCTLGALDHLLTCGHKVMTAQPQNCSSNCNQPLNSAYINPRSLDEPFVCMTCITQQIKREHAEKVLSFYETLEPVARATRKTDPEQWIVAKVNFVEEVWREVELEQMKSRATAGRFCYAFYVDEEYEDLVRAIAGMPFVRSHDRECRSTAASTTRDEATVKGNRDLETPSRIPRTSSPPVSSRTTLKESRLPVALKCR